MTGRKGHPQEYTPDPTPARLTCADASGLATHIDGMTDAHLAALPGVIVAEVLEQLRDARQRLERKAERIGAAEKRLLASWGNRS
jgi:hypothetical protein